MILARKIIFILVTFLIILTFKDYWYGSELVLRYLIGILLISLMAKEWLMVRIEEKEEELKK